MKKQMPYKMGDKTSNQSFRMRIYNAFWAMKDLGISEVKVKPVLKSLLKLYDKEFELIEEENYRALKNAIFEKDQADAAKQVKNVKIEVEDIRQDAAQATEEPVRPLKRLRRKYQDGQTSSENTSNTVVTKPLIVQPKEEPSELPEIHSGKLNGSKGIVDSHEASAFKSQAVANQSLGNNKRKQTNFSKSLVIHEGGDATNGGISRSQQNNGVEPRSPLMSLQTKRKGSESSQISSKEKRPFPESSSQVVITKMPNVEPSKHAKEEPSELPETHSGKLNGSKGIEDSPEVAEVSLNTLAEAAEELAKENANNEVDNIMQEEAQATEEPVRSPDKRVKDVNHWLVSAQNTMVRLGADMTFHQLKEAEQKQKLELLEKHVFHARLEIHCLNEQLAAANAENKELQSRGSWISPEELTRVKEEEAAKHVKLQNEHHFELNCLNEQLAAANAENKKLQGSWISPEELARIKEEEAAKHLKLQNKHQVELNCLNEQLAAANAEIKKLQGSWISPEELTKIKEEEAAKHVKLQKKHHVELNCLNEQLAAANAGIKKLQGSWISPEELTRIKEEEAAKHVKLQNKHHMELNCLNEKLASANAENKELQSRSSWISPEELTKIKEEESAKLVKLQNKHHVELKKEYRRGWEECGKRAMIAVNEAVGTSVEDCLEDTIEADAS